MKLLRYYSRNSILSIANKRKGYKSIVLRCMHGRKKRFSFLNQKLSSENFYIFYFYLNRGKFLKELDLFLVLVLRVENKKGGEWN